MVAPITVSCLEGCNWLLHRFTEVKFLKLTDINQIFRNAFVRHYFTSVKFKLKLLSTNFFLPMISCNELSTLCFDGFLAAKGTENLEIARYASLGRG